MLAATLADAMRELDPTLRFEGIGGERMAAAGFRMTARTRNWASLGPLEALGRIPPLVAEAWRHMLWLCLRPPDLIVLIDFGAFNLRMAGTLRRLGYRGPILYYFPPGAWFDRESQARAVAAVSVPLTPFVHQRDFYTRIGLEAAYFGHPLVSLVAPRARKGPAAPGGGTVALLPGSRSGEIARHAAPMFAACELLRGTRPNLEVVIAAADADAARKLAAAARGVKFEARLVRGASAALDLADAALVASGTAVLEAALREIPCVALYIVGRSQVEIARRVWRKPFVTLPNILLEREAIPELLQDAATPQRLAAALETVLQDPTAQLEAVREVRSLLGPPDALRRCAAFALALARRHRTR